MPRAPVPTPADVDAARATSTLELLFRTARIVNEHAIARVRASRGAPRLRVAHTALFPHVPPDGIRLTALASRLGVSKQAVGPLVDDLTRAGVLARVADPDDGRARRIVWTARGRRGLLHGLGVLAGLEAELASAIGPDRMTALRDGLAALLSAVSAADVVPSTTWRNGSLPPPRPGPRRGGPGARRPGRPRRR